MPTLNRFLVQTFACPKPAPAPAVKPADRLPPVNRRSLLWSPPVAPAKKQDGEQQEFVTEWQLA
jgi:hypothetical protein